MMDFKIFCTDYKGMLDIIERNPKNAYLRQIERGPEKPENPLPMLNVRPECNYVVATDAEGLIIGAATLYSKKSGEPNL